MKTILPKLNSSRENNGVNIMNNADFFPQTEAETCSYHTSDNGNESPGHIISEKIPVVNDKSFSHKLRDCFHDHKKEGEHAVDVHLNKIQKNIPLKTLEDLKSFDVSLTEVEGMNKTLGSFIKSIGGRDLGDHINRCLIQIFSNELATKCSWHGQLGNFKLNNLIMKILTDVLLFIHDEATLDEVEKHTTEWFSLSHQRLKRKKINMVLFLFNKIHI
ncbi:hypothetical protein JTB14_006769 [Gonioctena quinquepunctata]|nr:hypothetical protein JTB14_006769 [Gonioctena quinquepunctata]